MIIFTDDNEEDIRLDSYLTEVLNNFSRTKIQNLIKKISVVGYTKTPH